MDNDPIGNQQDQRTEADRRGSVTIELRKGSERMERIERQLAENTATTVENTEAIKAVRERTDEMVEVFMAMKGGFKVLGWLGQLAKWMAPIIAVLAAWRHADWWPFH